jgi:hypothetical protein
VVGEENVALDSIDINDFLSEPDSEAAHIYDNWRTWNDARSVYKKVVNEVTQYIEATDTKGTTNVDGDYNHTTNRPKITQIYDNLIANYKPGLMPTRDWLAWEGENDEAVEKSNRKLMESYLRTKHRLSGFSRTVDKLLDDWVRTGNAFAGVEYVNNFYKDKDKAKLTRGYKGPKVFRIDPFDIVFNPTSTDFESTPKIVKSHYGIGDLERKADTISEPHRDKYVQILQRLKQDRAFTFQNPKFTLSGPGIEETEKYYQMTFSGFGNYTQYLKSGLVEVLEFYGDIYNSATGDWEPDRHVVIVDRRYVILNEPCPTWNGKPHIYHCGWRERRNNLWGMGPLEGLIGMQYRINHLENLKADAFDQMVDADEVHIGDVEVGYTDTGAKEYLVTEGGDVRRLSPDTTILQADIQIGELEAAMDLYAGSPREAMGFRTPGEKTKFEVSELMNAAGKIFQHKLEKFEEYMIEPILNAEIEVARQASDHKDTVELIDPENGSKIFTNISSEDLYMNGKYIPVGARHYSRQQQLARDARDMLTTIVQDEGILQHFPGERLAKLFEEVMGFDEHQLFQKFGRITEQIEADRLIAAGAKQRQEEEDVPIEEPETEEFDINEAGFEDPFEGVPQSIS